MIYHSDTLSFRVLAAYRYVHPDGHFFVKPRPFSSLSFRLGGTADFKVGDRCLAARPGDVVFVPRNIPYEVEYLGSEYLVVELEGCHYGEAEVITPRAAAEISLLFRHLLDMWQRSRSVNGAKAAVYTILARLEDEGRQTVEDTPFTRCLQDIEAHFSDPDLDIAAVCHRGFISVSSLQRAFVRRLGMSPMQYVIRLRMNKAVQLLVERRLPVKEVAYLCGFSDEKYFSRAFKKAYGYPPSALRTKSTV